MLYMKGAKSTESQFQFRTIWFWKLCEKNYYSCEPVNAKNSKKIPSKIRPIKSDFLHWIIVMTHSKPYSSELKLRRLRFGTFWRFLTFNLAKLSLKAETSHMEMNFWKKFSHFALQGKNFWNYGFMVDTQTLPVTMPSFTYITCHKKGEHNFCLVFKSMHVLKCDLCTCKV